MLCPVAAKAVLFGGLAGELQRQASLPRAAFSGYQLNSGKTVGDQSVSQDAQLGSRPKLDHRLLRP